MSWPWRKAEVRSASSYTDQLVSLLSAQASGGTTGLPAATAALEAASGLVARSFAVADVSGPVPITAALTAPCLALIARELIRRGEFVARIRTPGGMLRLDVAESWDVRGGHDPMTWHYRINLPGPSEQMTIDRVPASDVLHVMYAVDATTPWRGIGPLQAATLAGRLSANTVTALANEAGGEHGSLLPIPRADGDDDTITPFKRDLAKLRGGVAVVEDASDNYQTSAATPGAGANYQTRRIGFNAPATQIELMRLATSEVLAATGVPVELVMGGDGTSLREAYRRFLHSTVAPLGRIVESQLQAHLSPEVSLSFDSLFASDLSGRARAFQSMVGGGLDVAKAAGLAGLMADDRG